MTDTSSFYGLGIAPKLLEVLTQHKFTKPTPIQQKAIPVAIEGKDLIGVAQTGTGKTLAFGVPMIQNLARQGGRGLVLLPTRELAIQVEEHLLSIGKPLGLRTAIVVGGASMDRQIAAIRANPHVIVATPGRLIDHLRRQRTMLDTVRVLVLDEADRMLDMGFAPQIEEVLKNVPKKRQTLLFSATMPAAIVSIAQRYMALPIRVEIARPGTTSDRVEQELIVVDRNGKTAVLERLLARHRGSVLVFTRTKWGAKKLTQAIKHMGQPAAEIHSNRSLGQRRAALDGFKKGTYRVLVATDIAARGIDVEDIELVVNYDLPSTPDDYVHRIGRTARAGRNGKAISLATPDQRRDVQDIERLIRTQLRVAQESVPLQQSSHASRPAHQPSRPSRSSDRPYGRPRGQRPDRPSHRSDRSRGAGSRGRGPRRGRRGDFRDIQLPRERQGIPQADAPKPVGYSGF